MFTSEAIENIRAGFRARETYLMASADEFEEVFELAEPGQPPFNHQYRCNGSLLGTASGYTQFSKLRRNVLAMRGRTDLLVDEQNPPVETDIERPARCERLIFIDDAVRRCDGSFRIAEQWVVDSQGLCECPVGFRGVNADSEMHNVELSNRVATLTE